MNEPTGPPTCILTGEDGENEDDCLTHGHEPDGTELLDLLDQAGDKPLVSIAAILDAEATLARARTPVAELEPGDRVVVHRAPPGEIVASLSSVGTVVSTTNLDPRTIYPIPGTWRVEVLIDGEPDPHTFTCSGAHALAREG